MDAEGKRREQAKADEKALNELSNQIVWLKSQLLLQEENAQKLAETQENLINSEKERLKTLEEDEEQKLLRKVKIEQMARQRRLMQVEETEKATVAALERAQLLRQVELQRLDKEMQLRRKRDEWEAETRQQEDALAALELQAGQKAAQWTAQMAESEHARLAQAQTVVREKEAMLWEELRQQQRENQWQEDIARVHVREDIQQQETLESSRNMDRR